MTLETHHRYLSTQTFGSLDGLRAISIIAVIWQHTGAPAFPDSVLSGVGSEGVTLFFAISGFLITTLLLRERAKFGHINLKAFYARRTLRIFPLYYAVLFLYVIAVLLFERETPAGQQFFKNFWYFFTYTSNWFVELQDRTIFYIAWSLAAEEQFYLLWPPVLVLLATSKRALALLALILVVLVALELGPMVGAFHHAGLAWFVDKVPLAIILGAAGALLLDHPRGFALLEPVLGRYGSSILMAIISGLVLSWPQAPRALLHLVLVMLVLSTCMAPVHGLQRLLTLRPLVTIGTISYGMYLLHLLAGHAAEKLLVKAGIALNWQGSFVVTLVASALAAALSYRYYESWFLKMKKHFEP